MHFAQKKRPCRPLRFDIFSPSKPKKKKRREKVFDLVTRQFLTPFRDAKKTFHKLGEYSPFLAKFQGTDRPEYPVEVPGACLYPSLF